MPIEIRELLIKVKIEEANNKESENLDLQQFRKSILAECKKEIQNQMNKLKER